MSNTTEQIKPLPIPIKKVKSISEIKTKRCGNYRKSKPAPGCGKVEGCKWVKNIGCLDDNPEIIKRELDKKTMKSVKKSKPVSENKSGKCKTFNKNKDPKCKDQPNCRWIAKNGPKPGHCS